MNVLPPVQRDPDAMKHPHRPHPSTPRPAKPPLRRWLVAASALAASAPGGASPLAALDCMIQPQQVVAVGTPQPGVVETLLVDRGDRVVRGQPLVQMAAGVERAALALAQERAAMQGDTLSARSTLQLAQADLARTSELYEQQFVSRTYLERQQAEAQVSRGRSASAEERQRVAARELALAQAQLAQRTLRSPVNGVVLERLSAPGELADQKPLLRLAVIDPLRVDVLVPAAAFGQVRVGERAPVTPELPGAAVREAEVRTVDAVIDAATHTFRVRLELANPGGTLPAGLRCKVNLAQQPGAAAPRPEAALVPVGTRTPPAAAPAPGARAGAPR
jgi:RND family efflux transporter MFP subunit